uniref:Uncharacterized protein n=1 Tax=Anguilla anguilla TaxID=7936 RepID=A0A0E9S259_ANGAN
MLMDDIGLHCTFTFYFLQQTVFCLSNGLEPNLNLKMTFFPPNCISCCLS